MNADKLTRLPPVSTGFRDEPNLLIIPIRMEVADAGCASSHAHPRGQLIYASHGVVRVCSPNGTWIAPATQAVWIPPNVEHEVYFPGRVTLHSLFVDGQACVHLMKSCAVINTTSLLRELIVRTHDYGDRYAPGDAGYRLMTVVLDEIQRAKVTDIHLPSCNDRRLLEVMHSLIAKPNVCPNFDELSKLACTSNRTLARLFVKQTGLTYGEWNRRLLIHTALNRLNNGASVTTVALELGYQSAGGFIEMFQRYIGTSPRQHMAAR